ncbi:MAG: sigma-54-dependent Fis family transcriptional regulator [Desulfobacterales bacterium]|nr:sigma-54-dependent Fis family transcriptional regulator [Desulfobacterales bacterium]
MNSTPILWIDNDPVIREMPAHMPVLQDRGVRWADGGTDFLADIGAGRFSLVIVDERVCRCPAMAVVKAAETAQPMTPVILTTAEGSVRNAVAALQAGAADYLLKPFSPDILSAAIHRIGSPEGAPPPATGATSPRSGLTPTDKPILTTNDLMARLLDMARKVAPSLATVLILGESGTGKELLAAFIHRHSRRSNQPFVAMNCAALPDTLAESELFGHEKGAFTGAIHRKIGKFELAHGGTLMLDEISEMPLGLQAKLLRVLQERLVDRVGGKEPVPVDVRVIAASNQDLAQAVADGRFREDLYYRLNVIPLTLPPLRHRRDDIAMLADHFFEKYCRLNDRKLAGLSPEALAALARHRWQGNVRELENVMERAVLISAGDRVMPDDLMLGPIVAGNREAVVAIEAGVSVREMEQALIASTLCKVNGNRTHAAEMLGISIRTLRNKLQEYKEKEAA